MTRSFDVLINVKIIQPRFAFIIVDNAEMRSITEKLKENKYSHLEVDLVHPFNHEVKVPVL
jgi:hypothetical protein